MSQIGTERGVCFLVLPMGVKKFYMVMTHGLLTYKDGYWTANETEFYIATEFDGCDWGSELISIFMKVSIFLLIGFSILVLSCIVICCQKLCKK